MIVPTLPEWSSLHYSSRLWNLPSLPLISVEPTASIPEATGQRGQGRPLPGSAGMGVGAGKTTPLSPFSGYKSILSPKASWQAHGNHSFSLALDWLRPSLQFWQSSSAPARSLLAHLRPGLRLTLWTAARRSTPASCSGGHGSSARLPARSQPCVLPRRGASAGRAPATRS